MGRRFGRMISARHGGITRASCIRRMQAAGCIRGKAPSFNMPRVAKPPKPPMPKMLKPPDMALECGKILGRALEREHVKLSPKPVKLTDDTPERRKTYIRIMRGAGYLVKFVRGDEADDSDDF